jgi:nitrite reductase (NADH) small subunit
MRYEVGPASEIPPGVRKIVYPLGGAGIGVFNVNQRYYAVKNICPHMGAPLCRGKLTGTTSPLRTADGRVAMEWIRDGEILRCPWHHWEFDIVTGRTLFPSRQRVATYQVAVEHANGREVDRAGGDAPATEPSAEQVPSVETYPVVVEDATVYLVLGAK